MKSKYEIIDNALNTNDFGRLENAMLGNDFPWYFESDIVGLGKALVPITEDQKNFNFFWGHQVFIENEIRTSSEFWNIIQPILNVLKSDALIRVKVNAYNKTSRIVHHADHIDWNFKHKGALFYLNDNDGVTVLNDGTEVESVANRILLFDSSKPHHSTTCTNEDRRININFNYF
jgi:hypothetical protein